MPYKNIFILALVFILFFACNDVPDDNLDKEANNVKVNLPSTYKLKTEKINVIFNSFNGYSKSAFTAYQEYIGFFGDDAENYKPKAISDFTEVDPYHVQNLKSLETILDIPVLDELNPLITSYKINARAFSVAINSCKRYYTGKGYVKDNFENGKAMHKPVVEIFKRFSIVDSLLRLKSNKIFINLEIEHLNNLKKNGPEVEYLTIIGKKRVSKLNRLLTSTHYDNLNLDELKVLYDKIKDTYDKLTELKNAENKLFNTEDKVYYNAFEKLFNSIGELYQRKKENRRFTKKELRELKGNKITANSVAGSPNKVIATYNEFLKVYNKKSIDQ